MGEVLEAVGIEVRFGGLAAVDGVTLRVAPGEIVGIIGPNGAGKSTLLGAISGHVPMSAGRVRLNGRDVSAALPYRRARLGMARSFQDARLFPSLTVREVLLGACHPLLATSVLADALGAGPARRAEMEAAHEVARVLELVDLTRWLDRRVSELSFGTTRALELAWLAARRPVVMLLDEPASGLQQSEVAALGPLLERVRGDAGVVLVDHDVPFVAGLADRLVAMHLGRVIAEGEPDAVLADPVVVEAYLGRRRAG
jgi:ABC-type branched-subunit amino acid transport system ATPase component